MVVNLLLELPLPNELVAKELEGQKIYAVLNRPTEQLAFALMDHYTPVKNNCSLTPLEQEMLEYDCALRFLDKSDLEIYVSLAERYQCTPEQVRKTLNHISLKMEYQDYLGI